MVTTFTTLHFFITKQNNNRPKFTFSYRFVRFPGVPGSPRGGCGSPGVRSRKVQRVILSVQSVLPSRGIGESSRKLEEVRGSWRKLEKVGEG